MVAESLVGRLQYATVDELKLADELLRAWTTGDLEPKREANLQATWCTHAKEQ
jgi:hypothetical protein